LYSSSSFFSKFYHPLFEQAKRIWCSECSCSPPEKHPNSQKSWDQPLLTKSFNKFLDSAEFNTNTEKARLKAVCCKESGAWLNAIPSSSIGTLMDNETFRIAIGLRLGLRLTISHTCKCGSTVDEKDYHGLSCKFSAGRFSRHHSVNDIIKRALLHANIPSVLEPTSLCRDDGKRPDGMSLIPWKLGKPMIWDFTCSDTMAPSNLNNSSKTGGSTAKKSENLKIHKYSTLLDNYIFFPIAVETFGVFGEHAKNFIHEISNKMTMIEKNPKTKSFLIQNISIAIQRGNAASVLGTFPPHSFFSKSTSSCEYTPFSIFDNLLPSINISENSQNSLFDSIVSTKQDELVTRGNEDKFYIVNYNGIKNQEFLSSHIIDCKTTSLQPRGLLNQSNYCYINSILQALIACSPFYNLLNGLAQDISSNEKRKPTPVIDGMCRFVKEFKHLPANLRENNRRSDGKTPKKEIMINTDIPFEPSWIYKMLNGIQTDLIEGRQEDAEEFLGYLLNGLNDEMLELIKTVKSESGDSEEPRSKENVAEDKEWQVMGPKNKENINMRIDSGRTPISDIFGGFLKSRIHRTGDHITENIQPFFTLQLNIEKVKTVMEALEALVTKYQLEGLTSSKTNEEVEAWQQIMLDELPIILILHLKCFDFNLDGCTKIVKTLEFPIDLKIEDKLLSSKMQSAKEKQYKLFAVVYHDGKEASRGHYVTDAFHVGYSSWLRYDDASVKSVQEENVLKPQGTRVPYLLFYRRCDTILL
jgi:ubiquitin C-terminal hydrolase